MRRINLLLWVLILLFASGGWSAGGWWLENMTDEQFMEADVNNDGLLTFEEYDDWRMQQHEFYRRNAYDIFNHLDEDGDGLIDLDELEFGRFSPIPMDDPTIRVGESVRR
jgi:Ca2+-binding EF-hand superfamily protein